MDDDSNEDKRAFKTPFLTPCASDANKTQEPSDADNSSSQRDYEQRMANLTRDLEQTVNLHYASNNNEYESESESDVTDQQPTEATDDSNDPNQLQKGPVEKTLDIVSFRHLPSQDRDDICSPEQDTEPSAESFSGVIPELDDICITEPTDATRLVCRESYCVPYTDKDDEKDEISLIKQTLTTTTTITTEYTEPKKGKHDIGHIMISYNHSTKAMCSKIAKALKNKNYIVWIDQDNISGDILTSMASAVENAFVVLMAINEQYYQSRYCRLEAEYSVERNKASIPMLMQTGYKPFGWLGIINGSKLHIDFSQLPFEEAFHLLIREIESIRTTLGVDAFDQTSVSTYASTTQSMTTMNSSWNQYQNVNDWNADDVIEWINREKLSAFQEVLTGFTGATLWQLYKIKFDSAPDYYRTVESLLPPNMPLRLFYNLTFNAALETLFSSSNHSLHR